MRLRIALIALGLTFIAIPTANAHTVLLTSDPAQGSTIAKWPQAISLTFNEKLMVVKGNVINSISLFDAKGVVIPIRKAVSSGSTITALTGLAPKPGRITVRFRVVSNDGHPISKAFTFTYQSKR